MNRSQETWDPLQDVPAPSQGQLPDCLCFMQPHSRQLARFMRRWLFLRWRPAKQQNGKRRPCGNHSGQNITFEHPSSLEKWGDTGPGYQECLINTDNSTVCSPVWSTHQQSINHHFALQVLMWENLLATRGFPSQRARSVENISCVNTLQCLLLVVVITCLIRPKSSATTMLTRRWSVSIESFTQHIYRVTAINQAVVKRRRKVKDPRVCSCLVPG